MYAYGGGVTLGDTEMMTQFDLDILLDSIVEIRNEEADARKRAANPNMRFASSATKSRFSLE